MKITLQHNGHKPDRMLTVMETIANQVTDIGIMRQESPLTYWQGNHTHR